MQNTRLLMSLIDNKIYLHITLISIEKLKLFLFSSVRITECYILIIGIIPQDIGGR